MRTVVLFFLIATMLFSCKKDDIPLPNVWKGPQTYGYAKAKRNGQDWEGSAAWIYTSADTSKIQLLVGTSDIVDQDTVNIELLAIQNIMTNADKYVMEEYENAKFIRLPFVSYETGFLDEIDAFWVNDSKYENIVTIESFDPITKTIKGRFSLTLKKQDDYNDSEGAFPSKVTFEEGTFEARYGGPK